MQFIENRTFAELKIGDRAQLQRTLRKADFGSFATTPADLDRPGALDGDAAANAVDAVASGMWVGTLISALIGSELPGPGAIFLDQSLHFRRQPVVGDSVIVRVTVRGKDEATGQVTLDCACLDGAGEILVEGGARVVAPTAKIRRPRALPPEAHVHEHGARYQRLLDATCGLEPLTTAVVHPCDELSLTGAVEAMRKRLIRPVLVGPERKIRAAAARSGCPIDGIELIDAPHSHAAAAVAVALARSGKVQAVMKGALHTDELLAAALDAASGLRTERRMSHVFVFDVPTYPKPLFITDAAINIYPSLADKRDIVQNAVDLAHALGMEEPKVAILSAVETVNPKIVSTVEAAALCKMRDRGQITGALLDGPLAFDNAISKFAAQNKHLDSAVAGEADILVVPDLESGNMLAKQLVYLAGADAAGIVLGARVPMILTSRADGALSRLASCAIALLLRHRATAPHQ